MGWFYAEGYLPEGAYLDFVEEDTEGRKVFRRQLGSVTVRFKEGDVAPAGLITLPQCFTAAYF